MLSYFLAWTPFIPHGHCYLWKLNLVGLHLISDVLIAFAYYSIPFTLLYFVHKRQDLPYPWIFLLFSSFIIACGTNHLMEIWTLWHPTYWLSGYLKAITAFISVLTAIELVPLVPKILALPSPTQLEIANLKLEQEIISRQQIEAQLRHSEEQFKNAFDTTAVGMCIVATTGQFLAVNVSLCQMFGYSEAELLTLKFQEITYQDDLEIDLEKIKHLLEGKINYYHLDKRYLHKDQKIIWGRLSISLVRDSQGLPQYFVGQIQDISLHKQAETDLEQAKEAAVAANQAKSIFLANMSHELRSPLNAILGFSQLMNQDENLSAEQLENLSIIHRSGEHLLTLINQILDLSKIEAGRMTLSENNFDLRRLLADIENIFSLKAQDKNIQLSFECAKHIPNYIRTDEVKLRQVLMNLVSNAIKFTDSGSVSVKLKIANESKDIIAFPFRIIFEVQDTGVGITPSELENLFKPFVQTASGQKVQEGTGLGLVISRQFVRLMGGEITVLSGGKLYTPITPTQVLNDDSIRPSPVGTTFKFDIPVTLVDENAIETQPQRRYVIAVAPHQPEYRLLVVDDSDYNRQLLIKLLKPLGFALKEAKNGQEAIEVWNAWEPHLIWMDMRMPVMNGYEATQHIKSTIKGQATAIIALTASMLPEEKSIVLSAGCNDFLGKPFQEDMIFEMLTKHLGIRFIYQERSLGSETIEIAEKNCNFDSLFAMMSNSWIVNLYHAALDADTELVSLLIEEVPLDYSPASKLLKTWVNQFKFEKLLALTEPVVENL